ncbi:Chitin synthase 8 [Smittium culicis]|uniref:chitin synthase n=1 Tax=Smittium culicis TaxID=133412 RepID=A0A1R1YN96_9FUNG|nr:Chitin synthase 8 [Smittium culicis]
MMKGSKNDNSDLCKTNKAGAASDDDVIKTISDRYESNNPTIYTEIGPRILLSVNPNEHTEENSLDGEVARSYVEDFKTTSIKSRKKMSPHIFKVVANSYLYMRQTEINQSILFFGDSGSGKTEQKRLAQSFFSSLKPTSKSNQTLGNILAADFVIESFTNAQVVCKNSTRACIYQELQFNDNGELIGCMNVPYMLETSRVTKIGKNERNFHIFHYLANGVGELRDQAGVNLGGGSQFEYLKSYDTDASIKPNDIENFQQLFNAMKAIGIGAKIRKSVFKVIAGILALGNVHFKQDQNTYRQELAAIGLEDVVTYFGVETGVLQEALTNKNQVMGRQRVEVILNVEAAIERRDELARVIYGKLFNWLIDTINQQLNCEGIEKHNTVGLVDIPGYSENKKSGFHRLAFNYINERFRHFMVHQIFSFANEDYASEGITSVPVVKYTDRTECLDLFIRAPNGLFAIMDKQAQVIAKGTRTDKDFDPDTPNKEASSKLLQVFSKASAANKYFNSSSSKNDLNLFTIQHFWGPVSYIVDGFVSNNLEGSRDDFSQIFVGDRYSRGSKNNFVTGLFTKPEDSSLPKSFKKTKSKSKNSTHCSVTGMQQKLTDLISTLDNTLSWFVICISPNERSRPRLINTKYVKSQVKAFSLGDVVRRKRVEYAASIIHEDFCSRYEDLISELVGSGASANSPKKNCEKIKSGLKLADSEMEVGSTKVFISFSCWRQLEDPLRKVDIEDSNTYDNDSLDGYDSKHATKYELDHVYDKSDNLEDDDDDEKNNEGNFYDDEDGEKEVEADVKKGNQTSSRKLWLKIVNFLTCLIPTFMISRFAGKKRRDEQVAWREKVALCMMIFYFCAFVIFWIGGLGLIICPKQNVFSIPELHGHDKADDALVAIRGEVFNMKGFDHKGISYKYLVDKAYLGRDLSGLFPLQLSFVCPGFGLDPRLSMEEKPILYSDTYYHDHRWYRHSEESEAFNYYQFDVMRKLRQNRAAGSIAYDPKVILKESQGSDKSGPLKSKYRSIIRGEVFDLTSYLNSDGVPYVVTPDGISNDTVTVSSRNFLSNDIKVLFESNPGKDVTKQWERFEALDPKSAKMHYQCIRGAFYIGKVDMRKSVRCYLANYMLLAGSIFIVTMILVKFLASIRFGRSDEPELLNMFVVCNIPCYTEGEESLKATIDSIARLKYDDKRKLIFIVCDGMIMGSGNDRPTPRIVLDILGVDSSEDSEALSYVALGDGMKQHNMGKVYSGLYEVAGHVVPYIVVAKCGTPLERSRPGNRGKRDSQIMLMRFFNKVHFNSAMTPLELEIFHQIKNVIGVNPSFYEYMLMVDADTFVLPDSMNRLVSGMQNDAKIMGICGETRLANSKGSWTTMMQVYEYFIAHFLSKAFESLFGTVTCLPGCFCMYRIRAPDGSPLLISENVVTDYSTNEADTLHKKNLLYLGEDRYLTTLMLKYFSNYKTKFVADAKCETNAPDSYRVLLSQRRRWINSTVHNLFELIFLPNMCGFCCFSMRFVVFIDLISTIIMPATLAYLGILVYQLVTADANTSYMSLYLLVAIYAMQAFVFILHKQWQHIGWMIIYLMAIPLFSFVIPVYAFWHFDDFSWGNTRVVIGDSGKKIVIGAAETEKFDPATIPMRKWSDYEKDLMSEMGTNMDDLESGASNGRQSALRAGSAVGNVPRTMSRMMAESALGSNVDSVYMAENPYGYGKGEAGLYGHVYRQGTDENFAANGDMGIYMGNESNTRGSLVRGVDVMRSATPVAMGSLNDINMQPGARRPPSAMNFGAPAMINGVSVHDSQTLGNARTSMLMQNQMAMQGNQTMPKQMFRKSYQNLMADNGNFSNNGSDISGIMQQQQQQQMIQQQQQQQMIQQQQQQQMQMMPPNYSMNFNNSMNNINMEPNYGRTTPDPFNSNYSIQQMNNGNSDVQFDGMNNGNYQNGQPQFVDPAMQAQANRRSMHIQQAMQQLFPSSPNASSNVTSSIANTNIGSTAGGNAASAATGFNGISQRGSVVNSQAGGAPNSIQERTRAAISQVLAGCDLGTISKKDVRLQVSSILGLTPQEAKQNKQLFNELLMEELSKLGI